MPFNFTVNNITSLTITPQEWVTLPDLTVARTEHGLAVVNGIPTVVGGVAAQEFLASVEQLDSSNDQDIPYQREWRLVSQVLSMILASFPASSDDFFSLLKALSVPRYDFALAHIPTSQVNKELVCKEP